MIQAVPLCDFIGAHWLILGPNVLPIVYYSHIPIAILSLFLGIFVLFQSKKSLPNYVLFFTILSFALWVFSDSVYWASNRGDVIMFVWILDVIFEPLVYIGCLYLLYTLIEKKDAPFIAKAITALLYLPIIILAPTTYMLSGFDLTSCLANEGPIALYYSYFIEIILVLWIIAFALMRFINSQYRKRRPEIILLTMGILLLLFAFSWGNITGSFTDDWALGQYGLFGMPLFLGFLMYSIVRFKTFNIKLIGAVALVLGLCALTFSLIFVNRVEIIQPIATITFLLAASFGVLLIRSIQNEVAQRERIEELARNLELANRQQVTLIHFITHQIKGFVAKSRNIFSMIMDGDFGPVPEAMMPMVEEGFRSDTKGANTIQEILNASNIKSGKVTYANAPYDLKELVEEVIKDLKSAADSKGLALTLQEEGEGFTVTGDRLQMFNAVKNLIDNSIKYTLKGGVAASLAKKDGHIRFEIVDTGVGITAEDMQHLFTEGGHGKESQKINVDSTGFGLFIVKNIVEAHKGKVWAESEGAGKGAKFIVELPA